METVALQAKPIYSDRTRVASTILIDTFKNYGFEYLGCIVTTRFVTIKSGNALVCFEEGSGRALSVSSDFVFEISFTIEFHDEEMGDDVEGKFMVSEDQIRHDARSRIQPQWKAFIEGFKFQQSQAVISGGKSRRKLIELHQDFVDTCETVLLNLDASSTFINPSNYSQGVLMDGSITTRDANENDAEFDSDSDIDDI